jgi:hypothetical protein
VSTEPNDLSTTLPILYSTAKALRCRAAACSLSLDELIMELLEGNKKELLQSFDVLLRKYIDECLLLIPPEQEGPPSPN